MRYYAFEQKMDIDHDGVISLQEFMETCIKVRLDTTGQCSV